MEDVTLAHAKEHLEELIERAARGEDARISVPKVGTVRLTPIEVALTRARGKRRLGHLEGKSRRLQAIFSTR